MAEVVKRLWLMVVRLRAGFARVGFVRDRRGGWMGVVGFSGGWVELVVVVGVVVVEARLVMRRGGGMRSLSSVVGVVAVGWREGAESLWERKAIG